MISAVAMAATLEEQGMAFGRIDISASLRLCVNHSMLAASTNLH
jgi:hypothetical protein